MSDLYELLGLAKSAIDPLEEAIQREMERSRELLARSRKQRPLLNIWPELDEPPVS